MVGTFIPGFYPTVQTTQPDERKSMRNIVHSKMTWFWKFCIASISDAKWQSENCRVCCEENDTWPSLIVFKIIKLQDHFKFGSRNQKVLSVEKLKKRSWRHIVSHISTQLANTWKKFQFQICVWVVAGLPQRLKSTLFDIFSSLRVHSKKFQKTFISAFEANGALSCQNGFFPRLSSDQWNFFQSRL